MHELADIFVEGDKQVILIYLLQSVDVRHFQVKVTSIHIVE